ncbi:nucleotidyltransferase family protein [Candidatus Bipolaricaulota bacterium]|nr:nucleotidyltransferase family protein [Candidatus Bipolaricaulota bacterium]
MDPGGKRIDTIVLAAGLGRRFGTTVPKPLASMHGRPMVVETVDRLRRGGAARIIVVVGHGADAVRQAVEDAFPFASTELAFVENSAYASGLASSFRAGIDAADAGAMGCLIHHADRPFVRPQTVARVLGVATGGAQAVVPRFRQQPGFPVYISTNLLADVRPTLTGDQGARLFLRAHEDIVTYLDVEDCGVVKDADTHADLERSMM